MTWLWVILGIIAGTLLGLVLAVLWLNPFRGGSFNGWR